MVAVMMSNVIISTAHVVIVMFNGTLSTSKKCKEYDQNILFITSLLSHITISTCTHVVRNSVKTNLRKHLNKL